MTNLLELIHEANDSTLPIYQERFKRLVADNQLDRSTALLVEAKITARHGQLETVRLFAKQIREATAGSATLSLFLKIEQAVKAHLITSFDQDWLVKLWEIRKEELGL